MEKVMLSAYKDKASGISCLRLDMSRELCGQLEGKTFTVLSGEVIGNDVELSVYVWGLPSDDVMKLISRK